MNKTKKLIPMILLPSMFASMPINILAMEAPNSKNTGTDYYFPQDLLLTSQFISPSEFQENFLKELTKLVYKLMLRAESDAKKLIAKKLIDDKKITESDNIETDAGKLNDKAKRKALILSTVKKLIDDKKITESDKIEDYADKLSNLSDEEKGYLIEFLCGKFEVLEGLISNKEIRSVLNYSEYFDECLIYSKFVKDCRGFFYVAKKLSKMSKSHPMSEFKFALYEIFHWILNSLLKLPNGYIKIATRQKYKTTWTIQFISKNDFDNEQGKPNRDTLVYGMPEDHTKLFERIVEFNNKTNPARISILHYKNKQLLCTYD